MISYEQYYNPSYEYKTQISYYYEQVVSYYDGTISNKVTFEEKLAGYSMYTAKKASSIPNVGDLSPKGKVKSVIKPQYSQMSWDSIENKIIKGIVVSKSIFYVDRNGICTAHEIYKRASQYDSFRLYDMDKYEYDSKYRFTSLYYEENSYDLPQDNTPSSTSKSIILIAYNDAGKKATVSTYNYNGNVMGSKPISKIIYDLNPDGTISSGNYYEEYTVKSTKASTDKEFNDIPNYTSTKIIKRDKNDNWIESYILNRFYEQDGTLKKISMSDYKEREIEYY